MTVRGQALTEMLVVLLGLVPLWFALLTVAGLQDLATTTQAAARYAAVDRALDPQSAGSNALRVRRYLFDDAPGPVSAAAPTSRDSAWAHYPPLWRDPATQVPWLSAPASVVLLSREPALDSVAGAASRAALTAVAASAPLAPGRFDLRASGRGQSTVRVELTGASLPWLPRPYVLSASASVLGDSWSAESSSHVASRVSGLSPLRVLAPATTAIRPLAPLLSLFEPRLRDFCPASVSPDILPPDRLMPRPTAWQLAEPVRC